MGLGVKRGTVRVEEYSVKWKQDYEKERMVLLEIFDDKCLELEHIGSTAIPGLIAKPIIDIAIKVFSLEPLEQVTDFLLEIGYQERVGRLNGRQRVYAKGTDVKVTHHLHVIEEGGVDWLKKIKFRNELLANPSLVREYAELKKVLVEQNKNNRAEYTNQKSQFIKKVLAL